MQDFAKPYKPCGQRVFWTGLNIARSGIIVVNVANHCKMNANSCEML